MVSRVMAGFLLVTLFAGGARAEEPRVVVTDRGAYTSIAKPGAPTNIVGLPRLSHMITMATGGKTYGVQYSVAHDPKRPGIAIPGEGYIGMPLPSNCNWYAGGFFDLLLNGKSIGSIPVESFVGRASGIRGHIDMVFDTPAALVRIRFLGLAGDDALYGQVLLEAKKEIASMQVRLRCYPSAFVSKAERHVLTPVRDVGPDDRAELDTAKEFWLLYYDRIFDAGHIGGSRTGVGPCAVLWLGGQTRKVVVPVDRYGITTTMDFKPELRDFRFVFFDYKGTKNEAAIADLRSRAESLQQKLAAMEFVDTSVATWPLARKQAEITALLASMPTAVEEAKRYRDWAVQLTGMLARLQSGGPGAIQAESAAIGIIQQWEKGIPALKLRALLEKI